MNKIILLTALILSAGRMATPATATFEKIQPRDICISAICKPPQEKASIENI